jgi:glycerol uptake facilitator-like aquaporin
VNAVIVIVIAIVIGRRCMLLTMRFDDSTTHYLNRAALNPARDFGPRLVTVVARWGTVGFTDCLPYLLGPIFGGPIGAFLADKVLML